MLKPTNISQKAMRAELLGELLAADEREEVIEAGDDRKDGAADQHVVQMADDEEGVVGLEVERRQRHHHARQAAQHEGREAADRRTASAPSASTRPATSVARKQKICTPVGIATASEAAENSPSEMPGSPVVNM